MRGSGGQWDCYWRCHAAAAAYGGGNMSPRSLSLPLAHPRSPLFPPAAHPPPTPPQTGVLQDDLVSALEECLPGWNSAVPLQVGQKICLPGYIPACDVVIDSGVLAVCRWLLGGAPLLGGWRGSCRAPTARTAAQPPPAPPCLIPPTRRRRVGLQGVHGAAGRHAHHDRLRVWHLHQSGCWRGGG